MAAVGVAAISSSALRKSAPGMLGKSAPDQEQDSVVDSKYHPAPQAQGVLSELSFHSIGDAAERDASSGFLKPL